MTRLVALLDKPSDNSMGAVPVVIDYGDHQLKVSGVSSPRPIRLSNDELRELIESGQAVEAKAEVPNQTEGAAPLAMWFGKRFVDRTSKFGVPPPPAEEPIDFGNGQAWLAPAAEVYARLVMWIEKAFRRAVADPNPELARLMAQVVPDHDLTRAALWYTSSAKAARNELEWFARLDRDAGRGGDPDALKRKFESVLKDPPFADVRALLITGSAGSGHREVAQRLRDVLRQGKHNVEMVSFGSYLRGTWEQKHHQPPKQADLQDFGQSLVQWRPFAFARDVLTQKPVARGLLIVDGVRHQVIVDAIHYMLDSSPKQFGVVAPREAVAKKLADREGSRWVEAILSHPTELEIPEILKRAQPVLHYDEKFHLKESELKEATNAATG